MALKNSTVNELLHGPQTSPILNYAGVVLVHGFSHKDIDLLPDTRITIQIARLNEELPLLSTKPISLKRPIVEELLVVHSESLEELELLLCTEKEVIDEYELKMSRYATLRYHHLILTGQKSKLYITLVIKTRTIPPSVMPSFDVQVLVQYLETPLQNAKSGVVILGRGHYTPGITNLSFDGKEQVQISLPAGPSDQPQWHHTFLFQGCQAGQMLHFLLFHFPRIDHNENWSLGDKISELKLELSNRILKLLQDNQNGVVFKNIPLEAGEESKLFIRLTMKLGVDEALSASNIPPRVVAWGNISSNGAASPAPNLNNQVGRRSARQLLPPAYDTYSIENMLPSHTAITELLDKYPDGDTSTISSEAPVLNRIIEQQSTQLKEYRSAIHKVGSDLSLCKEKILTLQRENRELKDLVSALREPILDTSLTNAPREGLIKEVIRSRKLVREKVDENKMLQDANHDMKVTLRKYRKDAEDIAELRQAHTVQNKLLQKLQDKVKVTQILERTCRDQEKVIDRLESLLRNYKTETLTQYNAPTRAIRDSTTSHQANPFLAQPAPGRPLFLKGPKSPVSRYNRSPPVQVSGVELPKLRPMADSPSQTTATTILSDSTSETTTRDTTLRSRVSNLEDELSDFEKAIENDLSELKKRARV